MNTKTLKITADDFGLLAAEYLDQGITIRFKAAGTSMHPSIQNGDLLSVAPLSQKPLKSGDIILYRINGTNNLIAHRILFIKKHTSAKTIYTRGDALGGKPEQIAQTAILGKVIRIEHNGAEKTIGKPGDRLKGLLQAGRQSIRHNYFKIFPRRRK
jgi:signal peptidase I